MRLNEPHPGGHEKIGADHADCGVDLNGTDDMGDLEGGFYNPNRDSRSALVISMRYKGLLSLSPKYL